MKQVLAHGTHVSGWGTSRLHEFHGSKFLFASRIEFICSKLSNCFAHVSWVGDSAVRRAARSTPPRLLKQRTLAACVLRFLRIRPVDAECDVAHALRTHTDVCRARGGGVECGSRSAAAGSPPMCRIDSFAARWQQRRRDRRHRSLINMQMSPEPAAATRLRRNSVTLAFQFGSIPTW